MELELLFKDKESFNPSKATDKQLIDDHRILHAWAADMKRGIKKKEERQDVSASPFSYNLIVFSIRFLSFSISEFVNFVWVVIFDCW